jgi:4-amino-4-deoxy-L-arabinose transferase-like glycosyltransferase
MSYWSLFVFSIMIGIVSYFLIIILRKVSKRVAVLVGISESVLTYILAITVSEMRIHSASVNATSYIIPITCAVLMWALFLAKGKVQKK